MTRKWHDHGTTLGQLRLFWSVELRVPLALERASDHPTDQTNSSLSIDEVHSVGSDRGAVLEVVVSRMKTLGTSTRFVAVSATVPNIADVAEWLGTSRLERTQTCCD